MPSAANRSFIAYVLILIALIAYLFVSAPPSLPEAKAAGVTVPVERVFAIVEAQNDVVRALWTQEIVAAGKKVGLKFDEAWREAGVEAGPLPALYLRETAKSLEKHPVQLSLFLGSDLRRLSHFCCDSYHERWSGATHRYARHCGPGADNADVHGASSTPASSPRAWWERNTPVPKTPHLGSSRDIRIPLCRTSPRLAVGQRRSLSAT